MVQNSFILNLKKDDPELFKELFGFASGGYTGTWNDTSGRLAFPIKFKF